MTTKASVTLTDSALRILETYCPGESRSAAICRLLERYDALAHLLDRLPVLPDES